jgi:hypothetical protein
MSPEAHSGEVHGMLKSISFNNADIYYAEFDDCRSPEELAELQSRLCRTTVVRP